MKKLIISGIIAISILIFFSCDQMAIKSTISDFENAINDTDFIVGINAENEQDIEDTLSPDSEFYVTGTFSDLLNHFDGFSPVAFSNLNIDVDGSNADVNSDADLAGIAEDAKFVMRKESDSTFFSPEWKIKQYWDTNNLSGDLEFVWKKLQSQKK
jgi:hypothetical protein